MAQGYKSQHLGGLEAWVASLWTAELHRKTISKNKNIERNQTNMRRDTLPLIPHNTND